MNNVNQMQSSGGIGFCGLLTILFIGLKLSGHIAWSWLWVVSPLWIPFAILLLILALMALIALISIAKEEERKKKNRIR